MFYPLALVSSKSDEVIPGLIFSWTSLVLPHSELCSKWYSEKMSTCRLTVWTLREGTIPVSVTGWLCLHVREHELSGHISPSVNSTVVLEIPSQPRGYLMKIK